MAIWFFSMLVSKVSCTAMIGYMIAAHLVMAGMPRGLSYEIVVEVLCRSGLCGSGTNRRKRDCGKLVSAVERDDTSTSFTHNVIISARALSVMKLPPLRETLVEVLGGGEECVCRIVLAHTQARPLQVRR
jgi:hypothetical protein